MKKTVLSICICALWISFAGCGSKEVEDTANEAVEVFSSGDINEINRLVFGTDELEFWGDESEPQEGILRGIFSHSTVSVKKVDDDVVKFEITAPDMEEVFDELSENSSDFTESDLKEYIEKYANDAETRTFSVDIPYTMDGENILIDYRNEDFINAITGGLVDAYKQLYMDALEEYQEGVN